MFEDSLVESGGQTGTDKRATVLISAVVHSMLIVVAILIPLFYTETIEARQLATFLASPPPAPAAPPPPASPPQAPQPVVQTRVRIDPGAIVEPTVIPREIARITDQGPAPSGGAFASTSLRGLSDVLGNVLRGTAADAVPTQPPAPPAPPASAIASPQLYRVGGTVIQANEVYKPLPEYPPLARLARIQGIVLLEAVISREGLIDKLRVIRGHPLLSQAALDAVKTWRYKPTLLNGEAVDVITTITVTFAFSR